MNPGPYLHEIIFQYALFLMELLHVVLSKLSMKAKQRIYEKNAFHDHKLGYLLEKSRNKYLLIECDFAKIIKVQQVMKEHDVNQTLETHFFYEQFLLLWKTITSYERNKFKS